MKLKNLQRCAVILTACLGFAGCKKNMIASTSRSSDSVTVSSKKAIQLLLSSFPIVTQVWLTPKNIP